MLVMALLSPANDDIAESTLAMAHSRCRAMLVTALPSPTNDDTNELTLVVA
jgi:hypothetical protein